MRKTVQVNQECLKESSSILRALAHPLRMKILAYIDDNKSINVNKIYNNLKLEQSITSQHLRILRTEGLVNTRRKGKFILYSVEYSRMDKIVKALENFLEVDELFDQEE